MNLVELKKKSEEGEKLSKVEKQVLKDCIVCGNEGCKGIKVYTNNQMRLKDLIEWAKCEHLLDGPESKVECIKNDGDFGASLLSLKSNILCIVGKYGGYQRYRKYKGWPIKEREPPTFIPLREGQDDPRP